MPEYFTSIYSKYTKHIKYFVVTSSVIFVLFLMMDKIVMPLYVRLGDEIEVPDVTEKTDVDAVLELRRFGFEAEITDQKYDPYHAKNVILSQIPEPFTIVKKGRKVVLTRSLGERNVTVPNLISLSLRDAELKLSRNNLRKGAVFYNPSSEFPEGVIISQSYEAGMTVRGATEIGITISEGPIAQRIIVPLIQEKTLDNAIRILNDNMLNLEIYRETVNDDYLPNTILAQIPLYGDTVSSGDTILVVISKIDSIRSKIPRYNP